MIRRLKEWFRGWRYGRCGFCGVPLEHYRLNGLLQWRTDDPDDKNGYITHFRVEGFCSATCRSFRQDHLDDKFPFRLAHREE